MFDFLQGYISRSVAGSFDNEGIAIFALILTYYFWIKAVKTGSLMWSCACALAYFYMVTLLSLYICNLVRLAHGVVMYSLSTLFLCMFL